MRERENRHDASRGHIGYGYSRNIRRVPAWLSDRTIDLVDASRLVVAVPRFAVKGGVLCDARKVEVALTDVNTFRTLSLVTWACFKKDWLMWCGRGGLEMGWFDRLILAPLDIAETGVVPDGQPGPEWIR